MGGAFANKSVGRFDWTLGWSGSAEGENEGEGLG